MDLHECDFTDGKCPHGSDIVWWLQQPVKEVTMPCKKTVNFPTYNVSLAEAVEIVKYRLDDSDVAMQSKVMAIEMVVDRKPTTV